MTTDRTPTILHYLRKGSILERTPFWIKVSLFFLTGTLGLLNPNYLINIAIVVILVTILLYLRLYRSHIAPFAALILTAVMYSVFWGLFSTVPGETVYVRFPWGTFISNETVSSTLSAVSRWLLILSSGFFFLTITSESEIVDVLYRDSVPDEFTVVVTTALNTVQFTLEDIEDIRRSLDSRGYPGRGIRNRAKRVSYIGLLTLLSNLKRIENLSASYALTRQNESIGPEGATIDARITKVDYETSTEEAEEAFGIDIRAGTEQAVGLYGNSGSGKTTVLETLAGIIPDMKTAAVEGEIRINGESVSVERLRRLTSFAFQEPEDQFIYTTVEKELFQRISTPAERERVEFYVDYFDIGHLIGKSLDDLSTGQRKLVSLVSALSQDTEIVMLDEPTANLDQQHRCEVFDILKRERERRLVFVSTHHEGKVPSDLFDLYGVYSSGRWKTVDELDSRFERSPSSPETTEHESEGSASTFELNDVDYVYPDGTRVLSDLTIDIADGEIVGIIGRNGSGKTTLLNLLTGKLSPTSGGLHRSTDDVGFVHQEPNKQLFTNSVRDELLFGKDDSEVSEQRVEELLELMEMRSEADRHPFFLSRGQKQMLLIASVVLTEPDVIIIDEPFTGLDASAVERILELLLELYRRYEPTIVITDQSTEGLEPIFTTEINLTEEGSESELKSVRAS